MKVVLIILISIIATVSGCNVDERSGNGLTLSLKKSNGSLFLTFANNTNKVIFSDDWLLRTVAVDASQLQWVVKDKDGRTVPLCGPVDYSGARVRFKIPPLKSKEFSEDLRTLRLLYCISGRASYSLRIEYLIRENGKYKTALLSNPVEIPIE